MSGRFPSDAVGRPLPVYAIVIILLLAALLLYCPLLSSYIAKASILNIFPCTLQGAFFAWKATAMGKNYINGKTFLEKR